MKVRGVLMPFGKATPSGIVYPAESTIEALKEVDIDNLPISGGGRSGIGTQIDCADTVGRAVSLDLYEDRAELEVEINELVPTGKALAELLRAGAPLGFNPVGTGSPKRTENPDDPIEVAHYSLRHVAIIPHKQHEVGDAPLEVCRDDDQSDG